MSQMRSLVLRLYDNRARQTSRSPEVYLNKEVYGRECYTALDVRDQTTTGGTIRPFRDPTYYQKEVFFSTERNKGGRVLAIAVDFIPGVHYFETIHQVSSIVKKLSQLHYAGYVHGDIRALNLVVQGNSAEFIDFDFCGKKNEVTYPPGYNKRLDDGLREGKANQPITTHDDFMALKSIFDFLHEPSRDCSQAMLAWFYLIKDSKSLSEMEANLENFPYTDLRLETKERFEEFLNNLRQHEVATTKETQELPVASTPDRFLKRDG